MRLDYPKQIILKDGQEIVLRLLAANDGAGLKALFGRIPAEERWYLRHDISDDSLVDRWVADIDHGKVIPVVAEVEGRLVGQVTLHLRRFGAFRHSAQFRVVVDPDYRNRRLGTWLILDIVNVAIGLGLERVEARFVVGPEDAAIQGARRLDFVEWATLPRYAKGPDGQYHDVKIMIKRLHPGWDDF